MAKSKREVYSPWKALSGCLYEQWMYTEGHLKWPEIYEMGVCPRFDKAEALCRMCPGQTGS